MINFFAELSQEIHSLHPSDVHGSFGYISVYILGLEICWWFQFSCIVGATRWIAACAMAFAQISAIFASNPAGPLPMADLEAMESACMTYRRDYNRISIMFWNVLSLRSPGNIGILSDICRFTSAHPRPCDVGTAEPAFALSGEAKDAQPGAPEP